MKACAPRLSLCIPTYNRAPFLEKTLQSIVGQALFQETNLVEVVVSDNCSTDGTASTAAAFQNMFPEKVRCVRTEQLVHSSRNFARVLEAGRGTLRKLHNDALCIRDGFLDTCLRLTDNNDARKPLLFFLNGTIPCPDELTSCRDLDAFIGHVSFYTTWIGGFSIWSEDVPRYAEVFRHAPHHFAQTEILFSALAGGREALVYNPKFGDEAVDVPKPITKHSLETIYFGEYLPLLREQAAQGRITEKTAEREIYRFCFFYYIPYYHRISKRQFIKTFYKDFTFIKKYVNVILYYVIHLYYILLCFIYHYIKPHECKPSLRAVRRLLYR
ncbi:MAG: glycosyltransferase [Desulfovibrio sp.]|jgi:glycosyltransferase involved in cell wall biosynthesis|nr:glycosyltransferase [Desulfovibrio sp.]